VAEINIVEIVILS